MAPAARGRIARDRAERTPGQRERSRDDRHERDRTCRRKRRRVTSTLLLRRAARRHLLRRVRPFELELADAHRVALLDPECPELSLDTRPEQQAVEVRGRFGTVPVDPGRKTLEAIAAHAEGLAFAGHFHVLRSAGEDDPPLRWSRRLDLRTRRAEREDALVQAVDALTRRRGDC